MEFIQDVLILLCVVVVMLFGGVFGVEWEMGKYVVGL